MIKKSLLFLVLCCLACGSSSDNSDKTCNINDNSNCTNEEYCDFPIESCGRDQAVGECRSRSEVCAEIYAPVCGCDFKTYGNQCSASGAGVSVAYEGECRSESIN